MKMKTYLLTALISLGLFACQTNPSKQIEISGSISPVEDSVMKFIYQINDSTYTREALIENENFTFKTTIDEPVNISINQKDGTIAYLLIPPGSETKIAIQNRRYTLEQAAPLTLGQEQFYNTKSQKTKDSIILKFGKTYVNSDFYADLVNSWLNRSNPPIKNQDQVQRNLLESQNSSSQLESIMALFERNEQTQKGTIIPPLEFPNSENTFSSVINQDSEYTLIDFWATWCGPCKYTNKVLNWNKEKLKAKGISITSISIDKDFETWKKGSIKEHISWNNVIDSARTTADLFKYTGIPFSMLVDREGEIIISNVDDKLIKRIAQTNELFPNKP